MYIIQLDITMYMCPHRLGWFSIPISVALMSCESCSPSLNQFGEQKLQSDLVPLVIAGETMVPWLKPPLEPLKLPRFTISLHFLVDRN